MPNSPAMQGRLSATLVLDDEVRLGGVLSSLLDGRLQLESVEPIDDQKDGEPITITTGSEARLSLDANDNDEVLENAPVMISSLSGNSILLTFPREGQAAAHRFREVIASGGFSSAPAETTASSDEGSPDESSPALVEATAQDETPPANEAYLALLARLEQEAMDELERAIFPFLADLQNYLTDHASHLRQSFSGNNVHYQASVALKRHSDEVAQTTLKLVRGYFQELTPKVDDDQLWHYNIGSVDELDLVGQQEFEDYLAIDRMVTLGENLHRLALEALIVRTATLIDTDPNTVRLPIHVRQLSRAFQRALTPLELAPSVLTHVFDYFAKLFIQQLDGFYEPLNEMLAEADILPRVEAEIRIKGSLLRRVDKHQRPPPRLRAVRGHKNAAEQLPEHSGYLGGEVREQATPQAQSDRTAARAAAPDSPGQSEADRYHQQLGEKVAGSISHTNPQELYKSVVDALNFKREMEGLAAGLPEGASGPVSGTWDGGTVPTEEMAGRPVADAESIAKVLSALQHSSEARAEVQQVDSVREYLANERDNIDALQDTGGLTAESLNQLDMVDNLFGTLRNQMDVSAKLQPTLGNLQIPLAKLALLDPQFFVEQGHAARAVVDKLTGLATSGNFPNRALETRINTIIDGIVAEYETDTAVFDDALHQLDRLGAQQERAQSRNVERVVRTMEGQETLADARREVDRLLASRLQPPAAPRLILDLVEAGWRDLLVLMLIREGRESEFWAEQANNLDLLVSWLGRLHRGEMDSAALEARAQRAEGLVEGIRQQVSTAFPTHLEHDTVLDKLKQALLGQLAVEMAPVKPVQDSAAQPAEKVRARVEDLPRLRRWVNRVEQLPNGVWLAYRDKKNNKKRMQLAWVSPARDRYIFVNERGQKVADLSAIRLARQLSRGVQPPPPADRLSAVDKSMYHTLEEVQRTLSFTRNHDSLTRLINRETFLDQMGRVLRHSQQKGSQHALLYLNIDQFTLVNDLFDRETGDLVLLEFARLLAQLHGKKSSSARIDGDEFAILLLDRPMEVAMQMAEKIRADIEATSMDIDGEDVSFTVSVGLATIMEHSPPVEDILTGAASAMRQAKTLGRNRVEAFLPSNESRSATNYRQLKSQSRRDLEEALATDRFVLQAQPIVKTAVDTGAETSVHYELLLGLRNEDGSLDSPEEFIDSAERYGFMTLVDRWVVNEAFRWISRLMDEQKVVPHLSINLSGTSVTDDSFMDYLLEQISEFGVGTSRLCFEITETGTISNLVKAADFVRAFRNIGCKFSIDDFGTGLSSHNYLRELPVDYVKIDGTFIKDIQNNRQDYAMARSINDLAHFLGQQTIAESVENEGIVDILREIGVDYLQGWGVGVPKPLAEVSRELSKLEQ